MCSLMDFAPSSSGFCACAAHEPLPTRATKAVVKNQEKSRRLHPAQRPGGNRLFFLILRGQEPLLWKRENVTTCGDCNVLRQLATGRSRPKAACQEMTITGPFLSAYGFDEPGKLDQSRLCRATSSGRVEADADFLSLSSSVVASASRAR